MQPTIPGASSILITSVHSSTDPYWYVDIFYFYLLKMQNYNFYVIYSVGEKNSYPKTQASIPGEVTGSCVSFTQAEF